MKGHLLVLSSLRNECKRHDGRRKESSIVDAQLDLHVFVWDRICCHRVSWSCDWSVLSVLGLHQEAVIDNAGSISNWNDINKSSTMTGTMHQAKAIVLVDEGCDRICC